MDTLLLAVGQALKEAFDMFWEVLWPLVLGFGLSAVGLAMLCLMKHVLRKRWRSMATATEQQHTASAGHGAHEDNDMAGMDHNAMVHGSARDGPRGSYIAVLFRSYRLRCCHLC